MVIQRNGISEISSAEHPIDTAFNNTSAIQKLSYDNQCANVGPFLRQLVTNRQLF